MSVPEIVTQWVGQALGVPTEYGEFPPEPGERAMVKAAPGDPVVKRYANGGGVFRFAYEVYLLVPGATEGARVGGVDRLRAMCDRITAGREAPGGDGAPTWWGHDVTTLPNLFSCDGNQSIYQAAATLAYIERG